MLLQAVLNGSRAATEHPALPTTPQQIAADAQRAVAAGAAELHLHVRRSDGRESVAPDDVAQTLTLVHAMCPNIPVGISTSATIVADAAQRLALVQQWTTLPDYASVNVHERGAEELTRLLLGRGVGIEAGIWTAAAAEQFLASGLAAQCLRILIEAHDPDLAHARRNAAAIIAVLDHALIDRPRLLHGVDAPAWSMVQNAIERGYDTRVGLEDMLHLPDGTFAPNNAALVAAARHMVGEYAVR
jgi:uncharacterized protein (DUF849 family)